MAKLVVRYVKIDCCGWHYFNLDDADYDYYDVYKCSVCKKILALFNHVDKCYYRIGEKL
jgi:hypothetical protein